MAQRRTKGRHDSDVPGSQGWRGIRLALDRHAFVIAIASCLFYLAVRLWPIVYHDDLTAHTPQSSCSEEGDCILEKAN